MFRIDDLHNDHPVGQVVIASELKAVDLSSITAFTEDPGRVIQVTRKLILQQLPCQAPGVTRSALGLVGPVSVYRDWVR